MITNSEGEENKYLIYDVGGELYGTPILAVREVIEPIVPKAMPNTIDSMTGVINLRGQVVGVIELRQKFNIKVDDSAQKSKTAFIIFDTDNGPLAAVVDKICSVTEILPDSIDSNPNITTRIEMKYLLGVGKSGNQLITLIKLNQLLSNEELKSFNSSKFVA